MNDTEADSSSNLAGQLAALQRQVFTLLMALIVVSGTLVVYLGYESYHLGKDTKFVSATIVQPYNQRLPAIGTFLNQLVAFGQTHPDFQPILKKYGLVPPPAALKK